jgi:5'-3' exonuclease
MLLLLDTASLYFRAFYGTPDTITAPDGTPVNAVRGLLDYIARLVTDHRPTHLVAAMDNSWRPDWRVAAVPSYKTHRLANDAGEEVVPDLLSPQVPIIEAALDAFGICRIGVDDYEADDVIGTLASSAPVPVDVVTGDRDLFQLVDDERQVRVLYIARGVGKHEVVDNAWVQEKYGIPAAAYVDYATMRGDASDGLPGVSGIGDKTAATLLNSYGDLEGILAAASGPKPKISGAVSAKLRAAIDYLAVAPSVVTVARDLDLGVTFDDLRRPTAPAKPELFAELTELLGLGTSAERVVASLANDP